MICDICGRTNGHARNCPQDEPPKSTHYCSVCEQGIYDGEEYIQNSDEEYMHYECVQGIKHLLEWLGYKIKTMEDF